MQTHPSDFLECPPVDRLDSMPALFTLAFEDLTLELSGPAARKSTLQRFFESEQRNAWIREGGVSAYVRKGYHAIGNDCFNTFDIASVSVPLKKRGSHLFSRWYDVSVELARVSGLQGVYVENVMNAAIEGFCLRRGFTSLTRPGNYSTSFYKSFDGPL